MVNLRKNKKGWVKIVEAFFAAMLIIVVVILVVNRNSPTQTDYSQGVYNSESYILRSIQLNDSLRSEIFSSQIPVNYDNQISFPPYLRSFIDANTPGGLICEAQLCHVNQACNFWKNIQASIYAQDTLITANYTYYNPVKLRMYCWNRNS